MNIYNHEFKMSFKSVIIWSVGIAALVFIFMSFYSGLAADAVFLNEMMSNFPKELLMAFGISNLDMSTPLGFYALIFSFCQVCLAIQAANYGFSILSVEERDLTADFLMAKPVSRPRILVSKVLAAFTGLIITNIVVWVSSYVALTMLDNDRPWDAGRLALLLVSVVVFQLFFLSVGMVVSLMVKKVRSVTPFSMALAFGMYFIGAFGGMLGDAKLELITPFKHFDASAIINTGTYDIPLALISVVIIIASLAGSYFLYLRRDIPSAA